MKLFEVKKENKTFMSTEYEECIPSVEVLKSIKQAGYKVYVNGRVWKENKK